MFLLSKLLALATTPMLWVLLVLMLAAVLVHKRPAVARTLLLLSIGAILLAGWAPLPEALLRRLERQYPVAPPLPFDQYAGVVVLGGATESARAWEGNDEPQVNGAAERMTTVLPMLRQAPGLQVLFTGGEGEYFGHGPSEADRARRFFVQLGLDANRILFESASRNTYENAVFSARLPGVDPQRPWILMTSAAHMPRALAVFRKQGWNVTPYSVDFNTGLSTPLTAYSLGDFDKWNAVLHEYVGIVAYRLTGRT
jgi:uncharacterized SAM-binding protein YcdF (DUF218 family)